MRNAIGALLHDLAPTPTIVDCIAADGRSMTRIVPIGIAALLALNSSIGSAADRGHPCSVTGLTTIDAFHPQPSDTIAFEVALGSAAGTPFDGPPQHVLGRISGAASLRFDVVLTADAAGFEDFTTLEVAPSGRLRPVARPAAAGTFGPFAIGEHTVTTVVYVFDQASGALTPACDAKSASFTVHPDSGLAPVVEFYHAGRDLYFMTQDPNEIAALERNVKGGWTRTGFDFLAYRSGEAGSGLARIARYRSRREAEADSHLFVAALSSEALELAIGALASRWTLEVPDLFDVFAADADTGACPARSIPVYRLWDGRSDANHRFTTDPAIKSQMIARGYVAEGFGPDAVIFCAIAP